MWYLHMCITNVIFFHISQGTQPERLTSYRTFPVKEPVVTAWVGRSTSGGTCRCTPTQTWLCTQHSLTTEKMYVHIFLKVLNVWQSSVESKRKVCQKFCIQYFLEQVYVTRYEIQHHQSKIFKHIFSPGYIRHCPDDIQWG